MKGKKIALRKYKNLKSIKKKIIFVGVKKINILAGNSL